MGCSRGDRLLAVLESDAAATDHDLISYRTRPSAACSLGGRDGYLLRHPQLDDRPQIPFARELHDHVVAKDQRLQELGSAACLKGLGG